MISSRSSSGSRLGRGALGGPFGMPSLLVRVERGISGGRQLLDRKGAGRVKIDHPGTRLQEEVCGSGSVAHGKSDLENLKRLVDLTRLHLDSHDDELVPAQTHHERICPEDA